MTTGRSGPTPWLTVPSSAEELGYLSTYAKTQAFTQMSCTKKQKVSSLRDVEAELWTPGSIPGVVPGLRSALGHHLTSDPFKSFVSPCCLNGGGKP